jgi:hypothetical protein
MVGLASALTAEGVDLTGWTLDAVTDISSDGNILVGYGTNPFGVVQAWRVNLTGTGIAGF